MGLASIATGVIVASLMMLNPEKLRVPLWLGLIACSSFILAGVAVVLQRLVSEKLYDWIIVSLIGLLAVIPAWIAFAPGKRACAVSIPFLAAEYSCLAGFGIGSAVVLGILVLAVRKALRNSHAA